MYALFLAWKCMHRIYVFGTSNLCVYAAWSRWTCVYIFFLHSEILNRDLSPEWVAIKDNTCAIVLNLCHNANNLPLWTWWQPQDPQSHSPPLSSRAKSYAPPEYMLKSLLCCADHAVGKICKKMFFKKNHDLYIINDLPITKRLYTYIHYPTKWGSSTQPSGDTSEIYIW